MSVFALTGNDTTQIAGRVLKNFGDGDVVKGSYPNDLSAVKTGKNGNAVFAAMASGQQLEVEIKVIRGSDDDAFLNALQNRQRADFAAFPVMSGMFVKRIGDGQGNITNDTVLAQGGIFGKLIEFAENTEGGTDQGQSLYRLKFANSKRVNM